MKTILNKQKDEIKLTLKILVIVDNLIKANNLQLLKAYIGLLIKDKLLYI